MTAHTTADTEADMHLNTHAGGCGGPTSPILMCTRCAPDSGDRMLAERNTPSDLRFYRGR